jgi:hypothetical protein
MAEIKPKHGGKRPGAGRPPGKVSAAKRELADMAKEYAEPALRVLSDVMNDDQAPPAARVSASVAILDRAYGKPPQAITGPGPNGEHLITRIVIEAEPFDDGHGEDTTAA